MTKKNLSALVLIVALFFAACGEKKKETVAAPEGMLALDLSAYGKPFSLFIPDTANAKLEVNEETSGALNVRVGKNFGISINEQEADLTLRKEDIKSDEVNKLTSYIAEEPDAIFWESSIIAPEYHFVVNKKVNNASYSFEDIRDTEAAPYGKEAVQRMFDSSRNIQATDNTASE